MMKKEEFLKYEAGKIHELIAERYRKKMINIRNR